MNEQQENVNGEIPAVEAAPVKEEKRKTEKRPLSLWRKAVKLILWGFLLSSVTLNFFELNYILPVIGLFMILFGFRVLKQENKWFRAGYILSALRMAAYFSYLVWRTTFYSAALASSSLGYAYSIVSYGLTLVVIFCIWLGMRAAQEKAGMSPHAGRVFVFLLWDAALCLGVVYGIGTVLALIWIFFFVILLLSIGKLAEEMENAGYSVAAIPVRIKNRYIVLAVLLVTILGGVWGYLSGNGYSMDWHAVEAQGQDGTEEIKTRLLNLGFPEEVLEDLSEEDITACDSALQIVSRSKEILVDVSGFMNMGESSDDSLKKIQLSDVAVQLPGEIQNWIVFHHFLWIDTPSFCGTEVLEAAPPINEWDNDWSLAGEATGRVLYDKDGQSFASDYYSLEMMTYTSGSFDIYEETATDIFGTFSMPDGGTGYRGYVAYRVVAAQDDSDSEILQSSMHYVHQRSLMQYPVRTALQVRTENSQNSAFIDVTDSLVIGIAEGEVEDITGIY